MYTENSNVGLLSVMLGLNKVGSICSSLSPYDPSCPLGIAYMYNCSDIFTNLLKWSKMALDTTLKSLNSKFTP